MKVLLLSTYDIRGGAGKAAYRLHNGLKNIGADSQMLVQVKFSNDTDVIATETEIIKKINKFKLYLDASPKLFFRYPDKRKRTMFSLEWIPNFLKSRVISINPDIINLHWICEGFLNIETITKLRKPIVWTLHDMWAFTGGCHYSHQCDRYKQGCENCPQMPPKYDIDLSRWVWGRKAKAWNNLNGTIVTPSRWLAKCAASSSLLKNWRIEVIPNGLNTKVFKPYDKIFIRNKLNLPQDKHLILFGAEKSTSDVRKGFELLKSALLDLSKTDWQNKCELVVFGAAKSYDSPNLGFKTHYLGQLNDETTIAQVYAAADVFVAPSLQDNLPNTVMESLACGTPCVAFDIGGMPDMIEHQKNGYLAKPFELEDLNIGITWVLQNEERFQKLSSYSRQKVEQEFTQTIQAKNYFNLYNDILDSQ